MISLKFLHKDVFRMVIVRSDMPSGSEHSQNWMDFHSLQCTLRKLYNIPNNQSTLILTYKDVDGDQIRVDSDMELQAYCRLIQNDARIRNLMYLDLSGSQSDASDIGECLSDNVNYTEKEPLHAAACISQLLSDCDLNKCDDAFCAEASPAAAEGDIPHLHANVICDACNATPIQGLRFKCLDCDDFDLCEGCFTSQQHREQRHDFLVLQPNSKRRQLATSAKLSSFHPSLLNLLKTLQQHPKPAAADVPCDHQYQAGTTTPAAQTDPLFPLYDSVGTVLTLILNSFGIDASYDVENRAGQNTPENVNHDESQAPAASPVPADVEKIEVAEDTVGHNDAPENIYPKISACDFNFSELPVVDSKPTGVAASAKATGSSNEDEQEGFTMLSAEVSQVVSAVNRPEESVPPPATKVNCGSISTALPDHIRVARGHMLNMGFNDKDGWLTRLLMEHNGDVSRCLDGIYTMLGRNAAGVV